MQVFIGKIVAQQSAPIALYILKLFSSIDGRVLSLITDSEMLKDVSSFSRQELEVACEDFSNIIGSSPDSLVYKGTMKGGPEIAVISLCIKEEHWLGYLELYFQKEVITHLLYTCVPNLF